MPEMPHSPTTSTVISGPNGGAAVSDYSEWAVTPHLAQQRWSGTTAQGSGAGVAGAGHQRNVSAASMGSGNGHNEAQEIMNRPVRLPSTIAELP
jgi:hypothetical protein